MNTTTYSDTISCSPAAAQRPGSFLLSITANYSHIKPVRIENVRKSGFADEIIIEETAGQKFSDIKKYHIDIFTVGSDWTGKFDYLKDYCKVVYLERTKNVSSTMLRA